MDLWDPPPFNPFMYCVLFHPIKILFGTILKLGLQKAKCQLWQKRFFAALLIVKGWNCNVLISEWGMFYAAMWGALLYSMTLWVPCHVPCETRTHHDPQVRPDKRRCACWQPCQLHQRSDLPGIQVSPYLAILWFHSINFGGKRIPRTESFRFFLFFQLERCWVVVQWMARSSCDQGYNQDQIENEEIFTNANFHVLNNLSYVQGICRPEDAVKAVEAGFTTIWVSLC